MLSGTWGSVENMPQISLDECEGMHAKMWWWRGAEGREESKQTHSEPVRH